MRQRKYNHCVSCLDRGFEEKLVATTLSKRTLKKLILDSCTKTAFSFNNQLFEQTDGVSMGSALGPVLANIILSEFQKLIVSDLIKSGVIKFYRRYVDDTLVLIKPSDTPEILNKFNTFDKNIQFTIDTFPDNVIHFLDILISSDNTDVYYKSTHTGQYTHFSSFEPFFRKIAWVKSLFHRASKLCSTSQLFENQIRKLKIFMSWNGFPRAVRNLVISKLKNKFSTNQSRTNFFDENDTRPKVWVRVPYLGKRGETLVKNCLKKIQRCLTVPINFIVIYDTKKFSYFLSNKDKIPNLSKSNVVYEEKCPGCSATYIGKTERCLQSRLSEHINPTKSAIGQHFHNCQHVQYIVNLHFAFDKLYSSTDEYNNISAFISNLIIDNSRILHTTNSRTPNFLLLLEAIYQVSFTQFKHWSQS